MEPIKPEELLADKVADRLREAIIRGTYQAGDRLREAEIAEQLGVSTIPVREAFRQLELEGLLEGEPRRGKSVRGLTERDLKDLFRGRAYLERLAYEMIHEQGGVAMASLAWLQENLDLEQQAIDTRNLARAAELDLAFHDRIYQETGSVLLQELWQVLRTRLNLFFYWRWQSRNGSGVEHATEDHSQILDGLSRNDLDRLKGLTEGISKRVSSRALESLQRVLVQADEGGQG